MDISADDLKINEMEKIIDSIIPDHMGSDSAALRASAKVQYYQLKKTGVLIETINKTNVELTELSDGIKTASTAQEKQSSALVCWTIVMAVAIAIQALLSGYQIYLTLITKK